MHPIPLKLRAEMAADPFMLKCIHGSGCSGRVEWEHSFLYAGHQIQEAWAIVPCCTYHHRGDGLDKDYNRYRALVRADLDDLCRRMPKKDWRQEFKYLSNKYN